MISAARQPHLPGFLSPSDRAFMIALAEVVIPAGKVMPAAGAATVAKVEEQLARGADSLRRAIVSVIAALRWWARLRHVGSFESLPADKRLAMIESWRRADYLRRSGIRLLTMTLKVAHYDDAALYKALGCVYERPPSIDEAARWRARVQPAQELDEDLELECDAVVVGTGAGGAVVARELAEMGHAVVMVEEGDYNTRKDFNGRSVRMQEKLYRNAGATFSVGNTWIPIPLGRTVGGTTTINSGTCFRPPERIHRKWALEMGLADFTQEGLAPYFERVESVLQVTRARPELLGENSRVIAKGCDALGYKHAALLRNAPDCDGQGVCCFGCPTDAKRSTNVSYVPLALRAGAQLFTGLRVDKVLFEDGRATGIVGHATGGKRRRVTIKARATVVAAGALLTPVLLHRSGLAQAPALGRNLTIHPCALVLARFPQRIAAYNGIPQGYYVDQFHDEGFLFEGGTPPLDWAAAAVPFVGPKLVNLVEDFEHIAAFAVMLEDTSRGRVVVGPGGTPVVTYSVNDNDVARMKRAVELLSRIFFAGGAEIVYPLVHGFDELRNEADLGRFRRTNITARDLDLTAYHPLSTARMGLDPRTSVVGADNQAHAARDLFITDGAAVPSSPGVNPQVTIMALATRAAEQIGRRLESWC